jgi:hypothetical protein
VELLDLWNHLKFVTPEILRNYALLISFHPRADFGNELSLYTEGQLSSDF